MKQSLLITASLLVATLALLAPNSPGSRDLQFTIHTDPAEVAISRDGRVAITAQVDGSFAQLSDPGQPDLPYRVVTVLVPPGMNVDGFNADEGRSSLRAAGVRFHVASEPEPGENPTRTRADTPYPMTATAAGDRFPGTRVRYLGTGYWHGNALAGFAVFPIETRGSDLHVFPEISVRVSLAPSTDAFEITRPLRMSDRQAREIERSIRSMVINPDYASTYTALPATAPPSTGGFSPTTAPSLEGSPVEYLIVTTDALAASWQRLADWKTSKGVPAVVRTVEWIQANSRQGSDFQETLRFFIADAYAKWGLKWVLLGGDIDQIPARFCFSTYYYGGTYLPVDLYFAGLDGTWNQDHDATWGEQPADMPDLYPEVSLARLTAETPSQVDVMIDKIISYETPFDTDYTNRVLFLSEVISPTPWKQGDPVLFDGATLSEYVRLKNMPTAPIVPALSFENYLTWPGSQEESRQAAIDSMSSGFNLVFHVGHGFRFNMHCADASVVIPDADTLSNYDRYSNMFLLNCTAVAYDFDCLAEHFLENPNGGAVSVLGANNTAFADLATYYMDAYAGQVFGDHPNVGDAFHYSRMVRTPLAVLADNADLWMHYIYTALADPEMPLWTGPTDSLGVAHVSAVPVGHNGITVTVTNGGVPVDSAFVCLWKDGEDYQSAPTDGAGQASFVFACESPGPVSVVVTGRNKRRYEGTITVVPTAAAHLVFTDVLVDDDAIGGTVGNGDGRMDAGETIDLTPTISNAGGTAAGFATITLSTTNPDVTILAGVAAVNALAPGASLPAASTWRVSLSAATSDGSVADFSLVVNDGSGTWDDTFSKVLYAPAVELTSIRTDDTPGNGNGTVENGEPFRLFVGLKNFGGGEAVGLTGVLRSIGGGATVTDSVAGWPNLAPFGEAENTAGFLLNEASTLIENPLELVITSALGHSWRDTLELRPPTAPSALVFDASFGSDRLQVQWTGSPSPDVNRYRLYRSSNAGGPYVRATVDAVLHSVYTDVGLAGNTRYYYVATSVDRSGNESAFSAESSASTNPPQAVGWPNQLALESANSPSVGDIDGDHDLEVIVGNDFLYAWHHDGSEILDGDGQPLTWGILSDRGSGYFGPPALAKIDNLPGLDIVAAAYTTQEVYIFNKTGQVLPGWPQPTVNFVRAGTVVGDIDGDESPEIVAIDQDGYLYVWNSDGTEYVDGDANPATSGVFRRFPDTPWWQVQMPSLADLNGDGDDEILVATQDSMLYVLQADGSDLPGWPRQLNDFPGGGLAVGDIDNDGDLEVVVTVRGTGEVIALHHDNTILWIRWTQQNLFFNPSPALADLNADGYLETIIPSSNRQLYVFDQFGNNMPGWPVTYSTTTYTESSPVVADLSGDGVPDVLLGDESKNINAWDASGNLLDGFPLVVKDAVRGTPSVADLDDDGDTEVIAAGYDRTVYVWDLASAYSVSAAQWPMFHADIHHSGVHGLVISTGVDPGAAPLVRASSLTQNYPNPFNPTTSIDFVIGKGPGRRVSLVVYDVTGARVRTLYEGSLRPGPYSHAWDGRSDKGTSVSSGVYFYRLVVSGTGFAQTRKMVLLK